MVTLEEAEAEIMKTLLNTQTDLVKVKLPRVSEQS